ncbi:MAG: hypothetical protein HY077_02380 [Elusimicrobia bacterium]|nr:hypothetical protein [Elusimicrobiota bacterium]
MANDSFGKLLAIIRSEQGYKTPYAFFRSRGGQRGLGLTFANYLRIERGRGLPKGWRIKKILAALDLMPHSEKARALVRAFLVDVLGDEELMQDLLTEVTTDPVPGAIRLAESAASQAIGQTKVQLDLDQYKAIAQSPTAYACHVILCNTGGWVEAKELADISGEHVAAVKKALKELEAARLVKLSGGKARSTLEKNYVAPPTPTPAMAAVYAKLKSHREAWMARKAYPIHTPYLILRASRGKIQKYLDHLTEVVNMSAIYGSIEKSEDSEMFLVEGRVCRLFPKDRAN